MSNTSFCKPKTIFEIHRDLCQKHIQSHSEYDLIGPFDKYRDENYKAYKQKCAEFKAKGKEAKELNIKALTNYKTKLGEAYLFAEDKIMSEESTEGETQKSGSKSFVRASIEDEATTTSYTSVNTIRESGVALRKRHERYYQTTNHLTERKCTFDPWFGRYLILSKFINAVRKVILTKRLLKRLKILKKLSPVMVAYYERNHIYKEHIIYPEIFTKFTTPLEPEKECNEEYAE